MAEYEIKDMGGELVRTINMHSKSCGKKNEHGPHYHKVQVEKICEGRTECGSFIHAKHSFKRTEDAKCNGVCHCAYASHPHDPTRHPRGRVEPNL